jgi:hypothetical protein
MFFIDLNVVPLIIPHLSTLDYKNSFFKLNSINNFRNMSIFLKYLSNCRKSVVKNYLISKGQILDVYDKSLSFYADFFPKMLEAGFVENLPVFKTNTIHFKTRGDYMVTWLHAADFLEMLFDSFGTIMTGLESLIFDNTAGKNSLLKNQSHIAILMNHMLKTLAELYEKEIKSPRERVDPPLDTIVNADEEEKSDNEIFIKVGFGPFLEVVSNALEKLISVMTCLEKNVEKVDEKEEKELKLVRKEVFGILIRGLKKFSKQRKEDKCKPKVSVFLFFLFFIFIFFSFVL